MAPNKSDNNPGRPVYSLDERKLVAEYLNTAKPLALLSAVFLSVVAYLLIFNKLDFAKYNNTSVTDLTDLVAKVRYVFIHLTPGIAWLLLSVWLVIQKRVNSGAINPMNGFESVTQMARNNLSNSVEHFIMSSVSQLILVVHLDAIHVVNIIPTLNLLFLIGRITFWLGYPRYRVFGFMTTHIPIALTIAFIIMKFVQFYIQ